MKVPTSEEWKRKVEKKLKRKIPVFIWRIIEDVENHLEDAARFWEGGDREDREEALKHLVEKATEYCRIYEEGAPTFPPDKPVPLPPGASRERELPPDGRAAALGKIVALLAGREKPVTDFRRDALGGQLLAPEEVPSWLKSVQKGEGTSRKITFEVEGNDWGAQLLEQAEAVARAKDAGKLQPGVAYGRTTLSYVDPESEWQSSLVINQFGKLGILKTLAARFKDFWPEAWAVHFILTEESYPVSWARSGHKFNPVGQSEILLKVSPYLSADKVRSLFVGERRRVLKLKGESRTRRLTDKHLALAVFAAEHFRPGYRNIQLLRQWNAEHRHRGQKWIYAERDSSNFARDMRVAYRRLTGWNI